MQYLHYAKKMMVVHHGNYLLKKLFMTKTKKIIKYSNAWLKIYDLPVVYFPKFFHPDPTVKRQSGFLIPTFKNSSNDTSYLTTPYFKVLS